MLKFIFSLMLFFCLSSLSPASQVTEINVPSQTPVQTTEVHQPEQAVPSKNSNYQIQMGLIQESYLQSSELARASERIFEVQYKYDFQKLKNEIHANCILGGYENNKSVYGAVPELFYQYSDSEAESKTLSHSNFRVTKKYAIGRKVLSASQLDQNFNLGLTNSYFTQDFISYQKQGLIGFHQDIDASTWGLHISLLPIYLPNQGPTIKENNGKIEGSNRWVKKPPTQFAFNDSNKEIIYSVDYSEMSKLVLTPGALIQFRLGDENKIHLVTAVSKRPLNEPVLERETFADLNVVGKVNLIPNVIYDDFFTADLKYQNQQIKSAISYISDRPENKSARNFYSIQNLNAMSGYSVFFEYDSLLLKKRPVLFGMAMAEFTGGEITDINADGSENIFTFTKQRLQYKKPMQFYVKAGLLNISGRPVLTNVKWIYDREQKGSLLATEVSVQATPFLNAHLGFDLIGTEDQKTEGYGFLQEFQANDRVYGGLDYVF